MKGRKKPQLVVTLFILFFLIPFQATKVFAEPVTTALTLGGIVTILKDAIQKAENTGDYLAWRAGIEAKLVLDSWKVVNTHLLDKAFADLNQTQASFFRRLDSTIKQANVPGQIEQLTKITELLNQTVNDAVFWDNNTGIYRHYPSVIHPEIKHNLSVTIRGINLDKNNPTLEFQDETMEAKKVDVKRQQIIFEIPNSLIIHDEKKMLRLTGTLAYDLPKGIFEFGKAKRVRLPISFLLLPKKLGDYEVRAINVTINKEYLPNELTREFHYSSGSLGQDCKSFMQRPKEGYFIDTESIRVVPPWVPEQIIRLPPFMVALKIPAHHGRAVWGENGSWGYKDRTKHGISVEVCAARQNKPIELYPPGYQHVIVGWKEYKEVPISNDITIKSGVLTWTNEIEIILPLGSKSPIVEASFFNINGTKKILPLGGVKFLKIDWDGKRRLILKPITPQDLTVNL